MRLLFLISALFHMTSAFTPLSSATDELQIRNKISLYAIALDTLNLTLLDEVFTSDVMINYQLPGGGVFYGLPAVKTFLVQSLTGFVTQHTLSTTLVEQTDQKGGVKSVAYLVANYIGQGNLTGSAAYIYGKYVDTWTKENDEWKIKARTLDGLPSGFTGNLAVLSAPNF